MRLFLIQFPVLSAPPSYLRVIAIHNPPASTINNPDAQNQHSTPAASLTGPAISSPKGVASVMAVVSMEKTFPIISGATVSSKAFESAVNTIFQAYGSLAGVEVAGPEVTPPETIIFPDVTDFTEVALDGAKKAIKAGDAGYVIVMEGQAAGPMEIYVGVGMDGKIAGVAAGANSETAGIGSQALEPDYLKAYIGKTSPDGIDNISGATETSVGVKKLVRAAMELAPALIGDTTPKVDLTVAEDGSASAIIGAVRVEIDAAGKVAGVTAADETADLASIAPEEVKEAMDNALAAYNASKGA